MTELSSDGLFRHTVPTGMGKRIFLIVAGGFVLVMSLSELARGAWPPNLFSLPILLILIGALAIGIPLILVGMFGPTLDWTVRPGRVEIGSTNPFRTWRRRFSPIDVADFGLHESDRESGPSQWSVIMRTSTGQRFETQSFATRAEADNLRRLIEHTFYA